MQISPRKLKLFVISVSFPQKGDKLNKIIKSFYIHRAFSVLSSSIGRLYWLREGVLLAVLFSYSIGFMIDTFSCC